MSLVSGIAIYVVIWWLVLFVVLPWGIKSQQEAGIEDDMADVAAPANPALLKKAIATTIVAGIVFGIFYAGVESGYIALDKLPSFIDLPERPDQPLPS